MDRTPTSMRLHIGLFGRTNVGKSTFLNLVAGQDVAITSPQPGTTTDPVEKTMELLPIGPVVFTDTGGVDDATELGESRRQRMRAALRRMDAAVLLTEPDVWTDHEERLLGDLQAAGVPVLAVVAKTDLRRPSDAFLEQLRSRIPHVLESSPDPARRDAVVNALKEALGRLVPYDLGPAPSWRNLRFPRAQIPSDATFVRVVADDASLTPGDWIAVTPPRVPELRSIQEYVGSEQPVLMDWAVGLAFPCQQPMLHANGVTEVPNYRITPDYNAKRLDTDTWQDGINGGLLGISDLLLRQHVMATYLSQDWGRDWGSLRRFETIVDATPAEIDLGSATRSGLWKPGEIRIKP